VARISGQNCEELLEYALK
jgi:hypothetical protein